MYSLAAQLLGAILFIAGLLTLWLPIPTGLILMAIGGGILLVTNRRVAAFLRHLRRRYRWLDDKLNEVEPSVPGSIRIALGRTRARRAGESGPSQGSGEDRTVR